MIQTIVALFFNRIALPMLKLYRYIFRPKTRGAGCLIFHQGHVLLVQHAYGSQRWNLPGGRVKRKETPENAVKREVYEEVGIKVPEVRLHGDILNTSSYKHNTVWIYSTTVPTRHFTLKGFEIKKAQWFDVAALPRNVSPSVRQYLAMAGVRRRR